MGEIRLGLNLEFARHADKSFEWAVAYAADIGYEYVEPMVHWGRELLSAAGYFHSRSMLDDPLDVRRVCDRHGVQISGLSSHAPLCKPDVSLDYLKQAVRFAKECGAPMIVTDDGPKPGWTTVEEDQTLMRYVLQETAHLAESRDVLVAVETHGGYTNAPGRLRRTLGLVDSPAIGVNFDTGNAFLSGNDPVTWLAGVIDRVVNVHAKDIPREAADTLRGKINGMLGCACGDGVLDWTDIVGVCRGAPRDLVLSVECGSIEDAGRSFDHLTSILSSTGPLSTGGSAS
ncbi:sugar phosphate isomerase/epimerase [Spirillospora sp. NBC_00431]